MQLKRKLERWPGLSYFSYAGCLIAIVLAVDAYAGQQGRPWDAAVMWQVAAVFFVMTASTAASIALETGSIDRLGHLLGMLSERISSFDRDFPHLRIRTSGSVTVTIVSALYAIFALTLVFDSHQRPFIIILVLIEALIFARIRPLKIKRATLLLLPLCITSWCLAISLTLTTLSYSLLNALVMVFSTAAIMRLEIGSIRKAFPRFRIKTLGTAIAMAACALYVLVALTLTIDSHRRFVMLIALVETLTIARLRPLGSKRATFSLLLLCITSWCLAAGLTYTNLGDWLLNGQTSGFAVVAFVVSMALVLMELCGPSASERTRRGTLTTIALAAICFIAFAFRSDNMLDTWIPYHRSFVADVAELVRQGYWLLWDLPSLYGFLSVLAVAILPTKDAWQGLFLLSGAIITVESLIIFSIWRWDRSGWRNGLFAIVVTLAAFGDNIARYPFSDRLYPQGALRFQWVIGLLFVAFLTYVWREYPRRVKYLRGCGHAIWLVSLFWSFEVAIWSTAIWIPYLIVAAFTTGMHGSLKRLITSGWPIVVFPIVALIAVEIFYRARLGHGPDFFGYVEFTGAFVSGSVRASFPINPGGAGWSIVLTLVSVGCLLLCLVREHRWEAIPLVAATWLAVWATSTYYAVEPFDGHVAVLLPILIVASAIVTYLARNALRGSVSAFFTTTALSPLLIVCIAFLFGEPSRDVGMAFPFSPGWTSDTLQSLPPIPKELSQLTHQAGILPGDPVLVPNEPYWTEISQGLIFPITRDESGKSIAYRSWVPMSPTGIEQSIMGVPVARRSQYIERHLDRTLLGGWYITYRKRADCSDISPRLTTERTMGSINFSASYCRMHAQANDESRTGS
jgi:hypothetical protein